MNTQKSEAKKEIRRRRAIVIDVLAQTLLEILLRELDQKRKGDENAQ